MGTYDKYDLTRIFDTSNLNMESHALSSYVGGTQAWIPIAAASHHPLEAPEFPAPRRGRHAWKASGL